jgi:hypothetical protein
MIVLIHDEKFVDAGAFGEKFVSARDGVFAEFLLADGLNLGARRHRFGDFALGVTRLHDVTGEQADEFAFVVHDRERAETKLAFVHHRDHIADELIGRNFDRIGNHAGHVIFHAADFGELLALRHVVMDEAETAVEGHGRGHAGFGDGVHVRRDDGDVELQRLGEDGFQLGVAREDFRVKRGEGEIVKREADVALSREKRVGVL